MKIKNDVNLDMENICKLKLFYYIYRKYCDKKVNWYYTQELLHANIKKENGEIKTKDYKD